MLRCLLIFITLTTALLTLPILLIRAQPVDNSDLDDFLRGSDDCAAPCFMSIKPGVTRVGEAMDILRAHPWVGKISVDAFGEHTSSAFGYGEISWDWSGQQPTVIDTMQPGRSSFLWDRESQRNLDSINEAVIETLTIHTYIRIARARRWYGAPDSGQLSERPNQQLAYVSGYHFGNPPGMIQLSALLTCPTNWLSYWNARTRIEMTVYLSSQATVSPTNVVDSC